VRLCRRIGIWVDVLGTTSGLKIENNTVSQCACGLCLSADHVIVRGNTFLDIDTQNFYKNGDTHAIGIGGGSNQLYEHNLIDGAGGSGITL
jgi:hypothetical protein